MDVPVLADQLECTSAPVWTLDVVWRTGMDGERMSVKAVRSVSGQLYVMAIILESKIIESKLEFQSYYYIVFWTNALGKGITLPLSFQVWIKIFYENGFGII